MPHNLPLLSEAWRVRFWSKIQRGPDTACWEWTAWRSQAGYGYVGFGLRHLELSHRVAYMLTAGPIPAGMVIRHSCDNPACCNPAHLSPGTPAENAMDRGDRGRTRTGQGERVWTCRLTWPQVVAARQMYLGGGESHRSLAVKFGVHKSTMGALLSGRHWQWNYETAQEALNAA